MSPSPPSDSETTARLDAIAKERDALRQEVTELRKSLESIQSKHEGQTTDGAQSKHEEEVQALREELEEANEGKEHFETQYNNLLGRVNTIKTSLGNRMKADAVCSVSCNGRTRKLTDRRPRSEITKPKSPNYKIKTTSCRRRTAVWTMNSRNCGRRTRHKRPKSAICGAGRICLSRTG
jgi:seryl-tRNA synthetase